MTRTLVVALVFLFWVSPCIADGAIALTREGGVWYAGLSFGRPSQQEAINAAKLLCNTRALPGGACKQVLAFRNQCASIAMSKAMTNYGSGIGSSEAEASANAVAMCDEWSFSGRCTPTMSGCDTRWGTFLNIVGEEWIPATKTFAEENLLMVAFAPAAIFLLLLILCLWTIRRLRRHKSATDAPATKPDILTLAATIARSDPRPPRVEPRPAPPRPAPTKKTFEI